MRILHVIPSLDPADGGPPMVVLRLAAALTALDHSVRILSYARPGCEQRLAGALATIPDVQRVQIETLPLADRVELLFARRARRQLPRHLAATDIVHLHGVWDPLIKAAADLARRAGVPYVVRPFGSLDPWCMQQSRVKKQLALRLGYRRMLRNAAFIHALNADEARFIAALDFGAPIRVVPNGVFADEFQNLPKPGSFYAQHPELRDQPFILFLSRLHYKKGLDYLAEAFARVAAVHPSVQLVVAGPDGGAQADFVQRISEGGPGLADRVHLVGPQYGRDKLAALVDAACFCLPSRQEGFSMAITEAMACGTPVVISEDCHFPEVRTAGAGEIVPLESAAVASALERMLADPVRRQKMGGAGRDLVHSNYTWPVIARQTTALYAEALAKRPATKPS